MHPFQSNSHTHSTWCDGRNSIPEMINAACDLGFVSLGMSGHANQGFDGTFSMSREDQKGYFAEMHALRQTDLPLRLWSGLEVDALSYDEEWPHFACADYILGSTHYLAESWAADGQPVAVDGAADRLKAYVEDVYHGDGVAAARCYFDLEAEFVAKRKPDIIGHFDLIRKHAQKIGLFHEDDPAYRKIALNALERCFPSGSILELNTGGMARGYLLTPYPTLELLCAWREMGGKVTVASDCHDCRLLTYAFEDAHRLLKQAGYKSTVQLGRKDELWEDVEL